ncbi:MAG: hypothetical protein E2600_15890 [Chryseobacterium sp.]|nr:hypothetical protein [Chryseobacterium sp.]
MKNKIFYLLLILPVFIFPQKSIDGFINNKIDFVLDNDEGKGFMGTIVTEYMKTDSLNDFYNKKAIQPFYKYVESKYFDKKYLESKNMAYKSLDVSEFHNIFETKPSGYYEYFLETYPSNRFIITSEPKNYQGSFCRGCRYSIYEPFRNFELSFYDSSKKKISIIKTLYSNVALSIIGIDIFTSKYFNSFFYNTLTVDYSDYKKENKRLKFTIKIYEAIANHDEYSIDHYIQQNLKYQDLLMRKVEITGNKEEAIKYLIKNKLDYDEIKPENYKEEDFKKKDK